MDNIFANMLGGCSERLTATVGIAAVIGAGGPGSVNMTTVLGANHRNRKLVLMIFTRTNSTTGPRAITGAVINIAGTDYHGVKLLEVAGPVEHPAALFEFTIPTGGSSGQLRFATSGSGLAWVRADIMGWVVRGDWARYHVGISGGPSISFGQGASGITFHGAARAPGGVTIGFGAYTAQDMNDTAAELSVRAGRIFYTPPGASTINTGNANRQFTYTTEQR